MTKDIELDIRTGQLSCKPSIFRFSDYGTVECKAHWDCVFIYGQQNHRTIIRKEDLNHLIEALQAARDTYYD